MKTVITCISIFLFIFSFKIMANTNLSHAIAMHGEPKYPPDFKNVEYVNPDAPKGGKIKLAVRGTFDSLNQFLLKGLPAAGLDNIYESLLKESYMMMNNTKN